MCSPPSVPTRSSTPTFPAFVENLEELGRIADRDVSTSTGYLAALAERRAYFKIDRLHLDRPRPSDARAPPTLRQSEAAALYGRVRTAAAPRRPTPSFSAPRC